MLTQADRGVDRAVLDAEHLGRTEIQVGQHAVALTGADRDGDPAPGRDALVGEQRAEARDRAPPHVNDERCGEDAGKLHAVCDPSGEQELSGRLPGLNGPG